ncbi:hypothetical protein KUCAC02_028774 [Chaenocephalus aceratus]|uniref:Uncharacterized protein n=1 Tax=Chaenocephalus aceratus TaxID=36190 RepID=A0ACB9X3L6_CHAAC|nr:hypothetical protein KUCAC02_028774 [Chaenocephalus aceratus]
MTGKRETSTCNENVNLQKEKKVKAEHYIPRYHELLPKLEETKGVPGPGQYHIRKACEVQWKPAESHMAPSLSD